MARWLRFAMLCVLLLAAVPLAAEDGTRASDVSRTHSLLVDSTREYRATLQRLLELQEATAARAAETAVQRRELFEKGFVSRKELEGSERLAASSSGQVEHTRRQLAEIDAALGDTLAAMEWARAAPTPTTAVTTPTVIGSPTGIDVTPAVVAGLDQFFLSRFARALPVSARGQTAVHDQLGLDHRHALDVAIHPDSPEGRAVIEYLQRQHIPFLAFRGVIPGASTGAHLHVGRPSARIEPAESLARLPQPSERPPADATSGHEGGAGRTARAMKTAPSAGKAAARVKPSQ